MEYNKLAFLIGTLVPQLLFATTCQSEDWVPGFCDLPIASAPRCAVGANNWVARGACVPATAGCAEIGGCFGSTPIGHWWPINENGVDKRCQCGCFAEETAFNFNGGFVTGSELIANQNNQNFYISSLNSINNKSIQERSINGLIYGPEKDNAYTIITEMGSSVTISSEHPVLICDESGDFISVKAAVHIKKGDFVLNEGGRAEKIKSIRKQKYSNRMVNFNVASHDPQNHFVSANGIILGDNAWQQRLASVDAKILLRADLVRELQKAEGNR